MKIYFWFEKLFKVYDECVSKLFSQDFSEYEITNSAQPPSWTWALKFIVD